MKKNILAVAIAAAVAAPAVFADATVYGNAHLSGNAFSGVQGASATKTTGLNSVSSNSSYLGVKGAEDLAGGMKAVYQMEFGVSMDGNNAAGTDAHTGINDTRNTFIGLGGGFGTLLVGRHDSLIKMSGRKYDLFGDQVGNSRNALSNGGVNPAVTSFVVDGRHNNVLAYVSPTWSGFHFGVAYVPGDAVTQADNVYSNSADAIKNPAVTAIADYTAGPLSVTAGYINIATGAAGVNDISAYRLGAGYTFGAAKIVGLYQNDNILKTVGATDKNRDTYGAGGSYALGNGGTIKGQVYFAANTKDAGAKDSAVMTTVGYDHALSKNTTAYAVYALADNSKGGTYTVDMTNSGTGSNVTAITGKDNSALSVGLIHKF